MKAKISSKGKLVFIPETGLESWAIGEWLAQNRNPDNDKEIIINDENSTVHFGEVETEKY